jgi:hypothetical protein
LRRAALALALGVAAASYAQTPPPDTAPLPSTPPAATAPAEGEPPATEPVNPPPAAPEQPPPAHTAPPHAAAPHPTPPPQTQAPAPDRDGELAALKAEVSRLQSALDAERAAATLPPPAEEGSDISGPLRGVWEWLLIVALLALAGGFVLGWRVLDRRIRRKYGGLRIY